MIDTSRFLAAACAAVCLIFGAGCEYLRQDMANQPKNRPLSPSPSFEDGRSERPLVENTVARGSLADDELFVPKDARRPTAIFTTTSPTASDRCWVTRRRFLRAIAGPSSPTSARFN